MAGIDRFEKIRREGTFHVQQLVELIAKEEIPERIPTYLIRFCQLSPAHRVALQTILVGIYDKRIVLDLPEGLPQLRIGDLTNPEEAPTCLLKCAAQLSAFAKGSRNYIANTLARQKAFASLLETLSTGEVEVVVSIKDKTPLAGLRLAAINEAFPELIKEPIEEVPVESPKEESPVVSEKPQPKSIAKPKAAPKAKPKATVKKAG